MQLLYGKFNIYLYFCTYYFYLKTGYFLIFISETTIDKNMTKRISIILIGLISLVGCKCNNEKEVEQFKALPFPGVNIPTMLTDPQAQGKYYVEHYWDGFLDMAGKYPSDSILVSGVKKDDIEQAFVNYIAPLDGLQPQVTDQALSNLWGQLVVAVEKDTSSNILETIVGLAEKYLYDPNSPYRNEDYYFFFADGMSKYEKISPELRGRYKFEAERCSLNKRTTPANDFKFADKRGKIRNLYSIKADYTLLFFTNPGCSACLDIITVLREEPHISELISSGTLAVVNIYIDEDINEWRGYMSIYPENWYNGFDPYGAIRSEVLYDVRAIPSLYLLDSEKKVILKDAPENVVFNILSAL